MRTPNISFKSKSRMHVPLRCFNNESKHIKMYVLWHSSDEFWTSKTHIQSKDRKYDRKRTREQTNEKQDRQHEYKLIPLRFNPSEICLFVFSARSLAFCMYVWVPWQCFSHFFLFILYVVVNIWFFLTAFPEREREIVRGVEWKRYVYRYKLFDLVLFQTNKFSFN